MEESVTFLAVKEVSNDTVFGVARKREMSRDVMFDEAFMLHWNDETGYGGPREESTVEMELKEPSSFVIKVMLITTHDSKKSLIHRKGEGTNRSTNLLFSMVCSHGQLHFGGW